MAYTGKASSDNWSSEKIIDLWESAQVLSATETPFLSFIGDSQQPVTGTYVEWSDHFLWYDKFTNGDAEIAADATSFTAATGQGARVQAGWLITFQGSNEVIKVASVNGDVVDITGGRNYGDSGATTHAAGATGYIVSRPALEGNEWAAGVHRDAVWNKNYIQKIERMVQISGRRAAVGYRGLPPGTSELAWERDNMLKECMKELERSAIMSYYHAGTPQGSSSIGSTMGGLRQYLTWVDCNGADLDEETHFEPYFLALKENGANPNLILAGLRQAQVVGNILDDYKTSDMDGYMIHRGVKYYKQALSDGPLAVIATPHLPNDSLCILSSDMISIPPLIGRSWQYKAGPDGLIDGEGGRVLGEYTMIVEGSTTHHIGLRKLKTT